MGSSGSKNKSTPFEQNIAENSNGVLREKIRLLQEEMKETRRIKREKVGWQLLETNMVVEHLREEQARRDATVHRWKQLYLAIKTELDDLILRTHRGERVYWGVEEEDMMEGLQRELKTKEETIKILKARLIDMEQNEANRKREVDILRQSLRIMSNAKRAPSVTKSLSQSFCVSK
ncbi:hypothetical protein HHK36_012963 [Tetracentron sinense]|uniref:Uncharacterized protein n=1 Tax=Tetracentron sinense TaxID=13715 RepID=A0A834Z946_TETSI|nr:hypothetical protein HHK36_012963 [Tetracentron sinense]